VPTLVGFYPRVCQRLKKKDEGEKETHSVAVLDHGRSDECLARAGGVNLGGERARAVTAGVEIDAVDGERPVRRGGHGLARVDGRRDVDVSAGLILQIQMRSVNSSSSRSADIQNERRRTLEGRWTSFRTALPLATPKGGLTAAWADA
jgi:hypothetical protein